MNNKVKDFVVGIIKDPMSQGILIGGGSMIAYYSCVLIHEFKKHDQENRRSYLEGLNTGSKVGKLLNDINNDIIAEQNKEIQKLKEEISELKKEKES